ncbi:MAG: hypothetical protein AB1560_03345 [Pseudomonadota bacterium]
MKWIARILLLFVLFTSVAMAWDSDNCGQDLVFDSASASQSHDNGSPSGNFNDLCGHCSHMGSHLLGYVASTPFAVFCADRAWQGRSATVSPKPSLNPLFRPPRNSFVA